VSGNLVADWSRSTDAFQGSAIKDEIEAHLTALVGLPVCHAGRALDMATFGFGRLIVREGRRGPRQVPEYSVHIQEAWRIVRAGVVLVGYADWHYPPRGSSILYEDFVEQDAPRSRLDDLIEDWLAHGSKAHLVRSVEGTTAGDLAIAFTDGCVLETFVNQASLGGNGDDEFWRLLPPSSAGDDNHFVVTARGIES
jgi:hypothetical protein